MCPSVFVCGERSHCVCSQGVLVSINTDINCTFCVLQGVPCDLVTGEERTFVDPEGRAAGHVACTIEMCSVTTPCKCACDNHYVNVLYIQFNISGTVLIFFL